MKNSVLTIAAILMLAPPLANALRWMPQIGTESCILNSVNIERKEGEEKLRTSDRFHLTFLIYLSDITNLNVPGVGRPEFNELYLVVGFLDFGEIVEPESILAVTVQQFSMEAHQDEHAVQYFLREPESKEIFEDLQRGEQIELETFLETGISRKLTVHSQQFSIAAAMFDTCVREMSHN